MHGETLKESTLRLSKNFRVAILFISYLQKNFFALTDLTFWNP